MTNQHDTDKFVANILLNPATQTLMYLKTNNDKVPLQEAMSDFIEHWTLMTRSDEITNFQKNWDCFYDDDHEEDQSARIIAGIMKMRQREINDDLWKLDYLGQRK